MERIDEMQEYGGGLMGYWKPRAYQKLDSGGRRVKKTKMKLRGRWRIKVWPKLKILQAISPKRIFARIERAYIRIMNGFADKLSFSYGGTAYSRIRGKEYDERLVLQLRNVLLERNRRYAAVGITGAAPSGEIGS